MAKVSPFVKWLVVAAIILIVPWFTLIVGTYLLWRAGIFSRAHRAVSAATRSVGVADAIFKLRLRSGAGLTESSTTFKCFAAGMLSPFIVVQSGTSCRFVSAIKVSDTAFSPERVQLGVSEAMKLLRATANDFCICLKYSKANGFQAPECTIVIAAELGSSALPIDIRTMGIGIAERASATCQIVEGAAPTLRGDVLRGRQIIALIQAGELMQP